MTCHSYQCSDLKIKLVVWLKSILFSYYHVSFLSLWIKLTLLGPTPTPDFQSSQRFDSLAKL